MALRPAKLGVSLFRHPCRKPLSPGKGLYYWGYRPKSKQGCLQSATQSHCTMQWHKWLTTCTGAPPLRPHFYQRYRFFDRLKHPVLSGCLLLFMLYFTRLRVCEISLFDLRSASAPYQCAVAVIQSELFINRCDVIHIDDIAPVASEKA